MISIKDYPLTGFLNVLPNQFVLFFNFILVNKPFKIQLKN